jgi:uncharacterized membrane protein YkvA (DUF1232 family)
MSEAWKCKAKLLKTEVYALYLAYKDPRVPWYARIIAVCIVGYAFSPIDLMPDPLPVIGYLDDLILVPLRITIILKMIPKEVMDEYRETARATMVKGKPVNWIVATVIVGIWIGMAILAIGIVLKHFKA